MWPCGANSPSDYPIDRSLRFRSSNSAYLSRTPGSATNRQTWTWSGWVKRGTLGNTQTLFGHSVTTDQHRLDISGDQLEMILYLSSSTVGAVLTTQKLNDPSAWYHIIGVFDSTNATANDRMRLYVNGTRVTALATNTTPPLNQLGMINNTIQHGMGSWPTVLTGGYYDGLMTEVNFIDGLALTPSSFGLFDPVTGVWKPRKYTGSYGTNGFYLPFSDNSALTTASNVGLGKDFGGNSNYWVTNGISLTAGYTYDSLTDVPTLTNPNASNFCVLNPLQKGLDAGASVVLVDGNLRFFSDTTISQYRTWYNTIQPPSGSYYFEVTVVALGGADTISQGVTFGSQSYFQNGTKTGGGAYGSAMANSNVLGFAVSPTGTWVHINGTWQGSATLAEINAGTLTHSIGTPVFPLEIIVGDKSATTDSYFHGAINFGQQPWAYSAQIPDGFKSINTFNLPIPTIKAGNIYMDTTTYSGNSSNQTITNAGSFAPDLIWTKSRTDTNWNVLCDTTRGGNVQIYSNATNAETASSGTIAFNSNGFSLTGLDANNKTANTYAAWQWKKGATPGFDVVTYTGNGTNQTIAHALGVAPKFIIAKSRSAATHWTVYHVSNGAANVMWLNLTTVVTAGANWNSTSPTSSVFSVGANTDTNANGATYLAYLWSEIAGFSKFGSYTGNGNADGPFVNCGFKPRFVLIKSATSATDWQIIDTARDAINPAYKQLYPDLSSVEASSGVVLDVVSNGFKIRDSGSMQNTSSQTYIYAAFAENPLKYSLAR